MPESENGAAAVDVEAFFDEAAAGGDLGLDAGDLVADVDAVGAGALVGIRHHEVFPEEGDGLLGRGRGEADEVGVEVFEDLAPEPVNGAVALVGDDEVEGFEGDGGIVGDVEWAESGSAVPALFRMRRAKRRDAASTFICGAEIGGGFFVEVLVELGLAAQNRVEPLNGADGDARDGVEGVGGEVLDVVDLGERAPSVGGDELVELALGLFAEVAAVDEEEDAAGAGEFDQPVGEGAGGVGLAGAGGQLDERARAVGGKGGFEGGDGLDLARTQVGWSGADARRAVRRDGREGCRAR